MRIGRHTFEYKDRPAVIETSAIVGPQEMDGPFKNYFKYYLTDDTFGQDTFEKAEREMMVFAIKNVLEKSKLNSDDVDVFIGGDLLNQIISTSFAIRQFSIPYLGVYNACSTYVEAMLIAAAMVDSGYRNNAICCTSSHFSSAERQYRFPLELGTMRAPGSQWTVTGSGACLISKSKEKKYPYLKYATIGRVIDYGIEDANNMGAAMAPACADTIYHHFKETGLELSDYDKIVTGDLGILGSNILIDLLAEKGYDIGGMHMDCGSEIYEHKPRLHQGGSGAAACALVFNSFLFDKLIKTEYRRILLVATGALLSPTSTYQGDSIPGIAHAIALHSPDY